MNIVFWILIILAAVAVWIIAVTSLFSVRVGNAIKNTRESIKDSLDVEERFDEYE